MWRDFMLEKLKYHELTTDQSKAIRGGFLGLDVVTAFVILSMVSVLIYKIFGCKMADITLPGGFKFKLQD